MELLLLSRIADGTQQIKSIMEERMKRNEIFFWFGGFMESAGDRCCWLLIAAETGEVRKERLIDV